MEKIFGDIVQNKNIIMFSTVICYILGLFAYFTSQPIIFISFFTIFSIFLIIKNFNRKIILLWTAIFYIAFFNASLRIKTFDDLFKLAPVDSTISGQIISIPNSNVANNSKFFFKVDKIVINDKQYDNHDKVLVSLNISDKGFDITKLNLGNYYEISGKLRRPFKATNPSQFSYGKYLKNFNTYTILYADANSIIPIKHKLSLKWKLLQGLNNGRNNILETHSKYLKSPNLEILGGIVFGDDAVAPPDYIKTTFINSGLLHILAASGMNVGFISGFLLFFLTKMHVPYNIKIISAIGVVILYALMTGLGASVIRASLMLIFIFIGKLIDRDAHSIALLAFVGLLMLIYNPAYINDVGFQLSFVVTFGILVSADLITKFDKQIPAWLTGAITIPVIAQIWVIPIQIFYFNTISTYSVFANIATMPFLSLISFGGFVSSVFALVRPIADFVCMIFDFLLNPLLNVLVYISTFFANLPHSILTTTHPNIIQILIYYVIILLIVYVLKFSRKKKEVLITISVLCIVLVSSIIIKFPNNNFEIISFDVGNGDAFLLKSPKNKYFIIDTGKSGYKTRSQADIIILKYMKDKGINDIEGLILTHFDDDHAGGVIDIITKSRVHNLYLNSFDDKSGLAKKIYKISDKNKFMKKIKIKNDNLIYSEKDFQIYTYKADMKNTKFDTPNENSIITYIKFKNYDALFMGDAGIPAFYKIKSYIPQNITLFKVGHHGAKNVVDREMMNYLSPEISLVSVGFNKFGHPNPLTMKLVSSSYTARTDRLNSIKVIFRNNGYELDGFDSTKQRYYKKFEEKY